MLFLSVDRGTGVVREVALVAREYAARLSKSLQRLFIRPPAIGDGDGGWVQADSVRLFWFIQTYRDLPRLRQTLERLGEIYPASQVLVVSDGDPNPEIKAVCDRYGAEFTLRERLYGVERGGELVQRILDDFLATDADILVKIDPDTNVRRRFTIMPSRADRSIYGTVQTAGTGPNRLESIQGGCIVIPRQAAIALTRSGLLESTRLKPPALEWTVTDGFRVRAARGMTSSDQTLGWACRELGIECREHPEVFSRYLPHVIDALTERRVAVSHPRFEIVQITKATFYVGRLGTSLREALRTRAKGG